MPRGPEDAAEQALRADMVKGGVVEQHARQQRRTRRLPRRALAEGAERVAERRGTCRQVQVGEEKYRFTSWLLAQRSWQS